MESTGENSARSKAETSRMEDLWSHGLKKRCITSKTEEYYTTDKVKNKIGSLLKFPT
jgi:hypothetical protein